MKNKSIYLVRHAQSESNVDSKLLFNQTNMSVKITDIGYKQLDENSDFLVKYFNELPQNNIFSENQTPTIKVWNSPYERTRITANGIKDKFIKNNIPFSESESLYICERQFGLIDNNHQYSETHTKELEHYNLHREFKHDFWARPPLGESPFDMCLRLDYFLKTILNNDDNEHHIIVSHGAAIKGLILLYMNLNYESYSTLDYANNCSITLLSNNNFKLIFKPSIVT